MSMLALSTPQSRARLARWWPLAAWLAAGIIVAVVIGPRGLHAPDWRPVITAPLPVQIHLATVLLALAAGGYLMLGPKGRLVHRTLGWLWSTCMLAAAAASLFIHTTGGFSLLHILSIVVLTNVPMALYAARRHNVATHSRTMTGVFTGGLLLAGTFAFLPGRLLWQVFFG